MPTIPRRADADLPFVVEREKRFLDQVGDMLDDRVRAVTTPVIAELKQATKAITTFNLTIGKLVASHEKLSRDLGNMAADFNRFAGWATRKGLREDVMEKKFEKVLEIVAPDVLAEFHRVFPPNVQTEPPAPSPPLRGTKL